MRVDVRLVLSFSCVNLLATMPAAAEKLYLQAPAVYESTAAVAPRIREECGIESMIAQHVQRQLQRSPFSPILPVADLAEAGESKALGLTIVRVAGVGGGGWSGSKGIDLRVTLFENGREIDSYSVYKHSKGGAFGAMKSTCGILERTAAAIGANVAKWLSSRAAGLPSPSDNDSGSREITEEPVASKTE